MDNYERKCRDLAYLQAVGMRLIRQAINAYEEFGRGALLIDLCHEIGEGKLGAYLTVKNLCNLGLPREHIKTLWSYAADRECIVIIIRQEGTSAYQLTTVVKAA